MSDPRMETEPSPTPTTKREAILSSLIDEADARLSAAGQPPLALLLCARFADADESGMDSATAYRFSATITEGEGRGLDDRSLVRALLERLLRAVV